MTHALSCGAWPGRRGSPEDGGNRSSRVGGGGTWRGIPVRRFVAGFAPTPPKIGTAPDALSRMRYSARASELDHRRPIDPASSHAPSERCFEPNFCGAGRSSSLAPRAESVCRTITATQDNGHRDATMVLAACRHGRGAGRLQNGYPARPEGQATHIWRPSNSLRRIARPTRRRCRQDYLKHGTSSGVRYTERSLSRF